MEYQPILVRERTTIGQKTNHYWFAHGPIVVHTTTYEVPYLTAAQEHHILLQQSEIPLPHRQRIPPSASPLERAGAWRYWDGAEL